MDSQTILIESPLHLQIYRPCSYDNGANNMYDPPFHRSNWCCVSPNKTRQRPVGTLPCDLDLVYMTYPCQRTWVLNHYHGEWGDFFRGLRISRTLYSTCITPTIPAPAWGSH